MPTLSGLTLAQARAATVTQIRNAMKARLDLMTKRQLIILDLWCEAFDRDALVQLADNTTSERWPDGQIKRIETVSRDVLGAKLGTKRVEHTYYPPEAGRTQGPVDTIMVVEMDAADAVVSRRRIKHFEDGRQPVGVAP